ncbi:MAG: phosphate ABC transporter permease subunit PstC [Chthonomonas sp.]|nr:phosphate ABC transporter permease subunit PstC [Chthonomonas sp.]
MIATPEANSNRAESLRRRISLRSLSEGTLRSLCFVCAIVTILTTLAIAYFLIVETVPFFGKVTPAEFYLGTKWSPQITPNRYGVLPLISGTFMIAIGAAVIAIPLGLASAIYLTEFATLRTKRVLKPTLEVLAGIPTVVYGYFALTMITPFLKKFFPSTEGSNAASGAIVVGIMILPLVSSLCSDALAAVPRALREGAYGLGSTKQEVTMKVVVPGALSGIMSSFILAISRAVGETMAVTLAAGATPKLTTNYLESIQTMTAYIVQVVKGDTPVGSIGYQTIFAVGFSLFVITFVMNLIARALVQKYRRVYE